jgi:hypothetical protein
LTIYKAGNGYCNKWSTDIGRLNISLGNGNSTFSKIAYWSQYLGLTYTLR